MTRLSRRRLVLATALGAALGGCGFRLRGAIDMAFSSAYVDGSPHSTLLNRLRRDLRANNVNVTEDAKTSQVVIRPLEILKERDILSLNADGKAREYRLYYTLKYAVDASDGTTLRLPDQIRIRREITFNDSQVLAKEQEENLLYRDMEDDLVRQLMRRLATLRLDAPATGTR
ncbi:MAG: hypothetical protein KDE68_05665 [Rhodocyclaceae bacterium]|nr:hypothetical protein [Rhodocyclaceae bacterium]